MCSCQNENKIISNIQLVVLGQLLKEFMKKNLLKGLYHIRSLPL